MKGILYPLLSLLLLLALSPVNAARIKDVADVEGVRSNQLVGYGLVVGLPGTGEQSPFTEQSFRTMLSNFGITLPGNMKAQIKNVAAVAVHAELPAFAKPGQTLDITVSSVGSAKSLRGGTLMQTFLTGLDGNVYAVAQGSLIVSGLGAEGLDGSRILVNTPTVGRIPNGAMVEREVISPFAQGDFITFNLKRSDFTTAKRLAEAINSFMGPETAYSMDATSVQVRAPRDISQRVSYLSTLENLSFEPGDHSAKIIINSRTGTIVIGKEVRLFPAAITHGGLTVTIAENPRVVQPEALAGGQTAIEENTIIDVRPDQSRMFKFDPGVTLDDLVRTVNAVGAAPGDLMAILEALKEAGAIHGELVVI
ncbi:flagellar basal body P-ring protein FlgI [Rheinheimera sp. YQF-2]|jgi:flagellar P-ring protein precursor FlgI|uniref:Flagellar P-ring protein n=1 Tax=Rheinheimera lutimaris TaxID=2740584 RepID=A0A7Y5EII0_9GAMM|nr:flagellar basal body P-ring protein FlgI [Rheinheimera lutimaris]NRQ42331.1 flagellar basal body P-ring protein FlgI [Rheinheimera lutimaris]